MSFGVATIIPRQTDDLKAFIKSVDRALYRAKTQGRNRVSTPEYDVPVNNQHETIRVEKWDATSDGPLDTHQLLQAFSERGYRCLIQNYKPKTPIGKHAHMTDEINLVLNGEIAIKFSDQQFRLKPGDYIHVPSNLLHEANVLGDQPLRMLIAVKYNSFA